MPVDSKGTVRLSPSSEIKMNDVYFVVGLAYNLMSVRCITDKGYTLVFDNKGCFVFKGPRQVVGYRVQDPQTGLY